MGSYWSSKGNTDTDGGHKNKKRKIGSGEKAMVKAKEYKVVYTDSPVNVEDLPPHLRSMFVFKRTGSMFFDEDGDLAHEFFEEERLENGRGVVRWCMRRIVDQLTPQGNVDVPTPRLRVTVPIVLLDSNATIVPR